MTKKKKAPAPSKRIDRIARPELQPAKESDPAPPKLTRPHIAFCTHYAMYFNGAAAVRHAAINCEPTAQYEMAHFLLSKTEIQENIRWIRKELGELHFDLANQLLAQYNAMRLADPTKIFDENGNLRPVDEWPEDCKLLLTGIEVEESTIGEGEAAIGMQRLKKVKLESRKSVIDSMSKVLGTFVQKIDHTTGGKPLPAAPAAIINITVGGKAA